MSKPKISIIVPVYNTEKYLRQCVDSILNQSFKDFELLLVDDGSKDTSGTICDEYAAHDVRVRVWHQENQGVSVARNVGLEHAQGEWIYFPDSDDIIVEGGVLRLLSGVEKGCLMSIGGYEKYNNIGQKIYGVDDKDSGIEDKEAMLHRMFTCSPYECQAYLWNKFFNAIVINTNHIRFDASIKFSEDRLFVIQYLCALPKEAKIYYDWIPVYHYFYRDAGAMVSTKFSFNPNFATDLLSYTKIRKVLKEHNADSTVLYEQALCMKESYRCYLEMIRKFGVKNPYYRLESEWYLFRGIGGIEYLRHYAARYNRKIRKILKKIVHE